MLRASCFVSSFAAERQQQSRTYCTAVQYGRTVQLCCEDKEDKGQQRDKDRIEGRVDCNLHFLSKLQFEL